MQGRPLFWGLENKANRQLGMNEFYLLMMIKLLLCLAKECLRD